jgi:hypothetical protein
MTRMGKAALDEIVKTGAFVPAVHSVGARWPQPSGSDAGSTRAVRAPRCPSWWVGGSEEEEEAAPGSGERPSCQQSKAPTSAR